MDLAPIQAEFGCLDRAFAVVVETVAAEAPETAGHELPERSSETTLK